MSKYLVSLMNAKNNFLKQPKRNLNTSLILLILIT